MNPDEKREEKWSMEAMLSTMWVFVMLNMLFADIFTFMIPGFLKELMTGYAGEIQITQGFLLGAAMLAEIPIAMVLLSRVLNYRANRWTNIVAGVITIAYVIVGGSATLPYIFFAIAEVACMALIVLLAWKWPKPERLAVSIRGQRP